MSFIRVGNLRASIAVCIPAADTHLWLAPHGEREEMESPELEARLLVDSHSGRTFLTAVDALSQNALVSAHSSSKAKSSFKKCRRCARILYRQSHIWVSSPSA